MFPFNDFNEHCGILLGVFLTVEVQADSVQHT